MIAVSKEIVEHLKRLGKKGDTYDDILKRIVNQSNRISEFDHYSIGD